MRIPFNFGQTAIPLDIPQERLLAVLQANPLPKQTDEAAVVRASLASPIGSAPLHEIVRPGEKIALVTSDITRPMPSQKVLPHVLHELSSAGIRDEDICIVFALGSHRGHTEAEKIQLVGEEIAGRFRCVDSNGAMIHLGTTPAGTPVDIFETVVQADRRICLGNIEFHYFAGYSGGAKAILPGCSTRAAIQANHRMMVETGAAAGRIAGNPVRQDIDALLDLLPIDFIVNVILDEHKNIVYSVAGHPIEAHRAGCALLDQLYCAPIPARADIVIVSPGGFPKDINLYQAQKALDNAKHAVKDGGAILWIASAKEGLGEPHFEAWMLGHAQPADMIRHIRQDFVLGGHKAAAIAMVMEKADIYLHSDLDDAFVRQIHLKPAADAQCALDNLLLQYGESATVIAMPFGGSTLPVQINETGKMP